MTEQLEKLAADSCSEWLDLSIDEQDFFLKEYAAYVNLHPEETEAYLQTQEPAYLNALYIAFDGISRFSYHPEVMFPAVKKILDHSYGKEPEDLDYLEPLDNIDTYELLDRHSDSYMRYIDLLASRIRPDKDPEYLIRLLEVFDLAYIAPEDPSGRYFRKNWFDPIVELANYGSPLELKFKAREVLKNAKQNNSLIPLTFLERIKKWF